MAKEKQKMAVRRRGYYRKDGTYVKPTTYYIKDKGEKSKTPEKEKWFDPEAPLGWRKEIPANERRKVAFEITRKQVKEGTYSASSSSELNLLVARRLQALANVTTDPETKKKADQDAEYFFEKAKKSVRK